MELNKVYSSEYYNNIQFKYREIADERNQYISCIDRILSNVILSKFKDPITWLDVGCGDGIRTLRIHSMLKNVRALTCIEESSLMAQAARENLQAVEPQILESTLESSSITLNHFDVITSLWNVLGHVSNRNLFLLKAYSYLKKGGLICIDVNNRYNIAQYGLVAVINNILSSAYGSNSNLFPVRFNQVETQVYIHSPIEIVRSLRSVGFKSVNVKYVNYQTGANTNFLGGQIFVSAIK